MDQIGFNLAALEDEPPARENVYDVIKELSVTCKNCRLYREHPYNRGMIWRGNPDATIAIVGIAPGDAETEKGVPLIGASGKEFERWMSFINLNTESDALITNVIQCQPTKKEIKGVRKQRNPEDDEIAACFGPRCLRVLRAMPRLQIVMTLGWLPARVFLGTNNEENVPKTKTHEGGWFESSILPGVGIFCLSHPAEFLYTESPEKRKAIQKFLGYFKREAIMERKIQPLAEIARREREAESLVF